MKLCSSLTSVQETLHLKCHYLKFVAADTFVGKECYLKRAAIEKDWEPRGALDSHDGIKVYP